MSELVSLHFDRLQSEASPEDLATGTYGYGTRWPMLGHVQHDTRDRSQIASWWDADHGDEDDGSDVVARHGRHGVAEYRVDRRQFDHDGDTPWYCRCQECRVILGEP